MARRLVFLPGVSGAGSFWSPVAELLDAHTHTFVDWPGLGDVAARAGVDSYADLAPLVIDAMAGPSVLVAQSMGGAVAVEVARRVPADVEALVLCATSGGIDVAALGAVDWRDDVRAEYPATPAWAFEPHADLSDVIAGLHLPVLLVWASDDPTSPRAIGDTLLRSFPDARLVVIESADHWVARSEALQVAAAIAAFLA